ncbi:hypothetical protein E2C01_101119 [Portunus trituberculatus]|uniref:Uncharacterized protein n=1 Tax=Portunus trituberculatus TaxID=210409 RepID=A0A5B7KJP4_PORTR|nr:hypothetical protein [Portunus trituberculatus]
MLSRGCYAGSDANPSRNSPFTPLARPPLHSCNPALLHSQCTPTHLPKLPRCKEVSLCVIVVLLLSAVQKFTR